MTFSHQSARASCLATLFLALSLLAPASSPAQGIQKVVTMESGLQFEGELAAVPEIVEGSGIFQVYGTQPIVRIDDGMRLVYVSFRRVFDVGESSRNEIEIPIFQRVFPGNEGGGSIVAIGPFNESGHRELTIRAAGNPSITYVQGITKVTPRYCELKTLSGNKEFANKMRQWQMKVGLGTVPSEVLQSLLRSQIRDADDPTEYLEIAELFLQAQQYNNATDELRFTQQKFPELKERIDDDRAKIRQAYAQQILREVRTRMDSGQTGLALALAKAFNKEGIAGETLAEFRDIENQVGIENSKLDQTRAAINELIAGVLDVDEKQAAAIKRLQQELETELNSINAPRLDAFLRLANDETMPSQQKISLAISGWMLGSNRAIENLAVSQEMFTARDLVSKYMATPEALERSRILNQLAELETGTPQYLDPMLRQMKPLEAADFSQYTGEKPIEFFAELPGTVAAPEPQKIRCQVHLPPEYDPYRRYPLLITLPGGRQSADQHLEMWAGSYNAKLGVRTGHAMRNGVIVMTVDWRLPGQGAYGYTAREHGAVLKSLRMALRKFSIDSDRVFLSGHGIGGDAAYDIGLSHPEHWAGVIGVSGKMDKYLDVYDSNKHISLPLYFVVGTKDFNTIIENKRGWNKWMPSKNGRDCTVVLYQGRANELFAEETPEIFKWMKAQRRRWPDKSGFEFECKSIRPWDCYFWFWEFDGIPFDDVIWPQAWREKNVSTRMTISAELKGEVPNTFRLGPSSPKIENDSTLWLSPEFIDFDKEVHIKGRGRDFKEFVKPSSEVLLEDIRRRADRQHPFWARVDCRDYIWTPNK